MTGVARITAFWLAGLLLACGGPEPVAPASPPPEPTTTDGPSSKPNDPRWRALPAVAGCDPHIAVDPNELGRHLEWKPCPKGQPGCRALLPASVDSLGAFRVDHGLYAGWTASGVVLAISDDHGRETITLAPLDGEPFLVLDVAGHRGDCNFYGAYFGADAVALAYAVHDEGITSAFFAGPPRADPSWERPTVRVPWTPPASLSGGAMVFGSTPISRFDPRTGEVHDVASGRFPCCGFAVGAATVFLDGGQILAAATPGVVPRVLHPPGPTDILELHMADDALFWTVSATRPDGGPRVELWTAPAAAEPERFAPRKVTDLDLRQNPGHQGGRVEVSSLVIGGGKVAVRHSHPPTDRSRVVIVDVASGAQRVWQPGPGPWPYRVVFVTAEDFAVEMFDEGAYRTYLRIQHDTLTPLPPG